MWKSFCDNREVQHETFKDAVKRIYDYVVEQVNNNASLSYQELETWMWVKKDSSPLPVLFYEMRDMAVDNGWIKDGKWVD